MAAHDRRRLARGVAALASLAVLTGCVVLPPGQAPVASTAATSPAPTGSPEESAEAEPSGAVVDGPYEYENLGASTVWSFEPTRVEVVEQDSLGATAPEGQRLVVLHIDGELLQGEPDFYYDFTVGAVNEATDEWIGLSSGSTFYAERDLFTIGQQSSFTDAEAIYALPESWPVTTWLFRSNETGEEWVIEVPEG